MSWESINFDMTDEGLIELSAILEPLIGGVSEELLNFTNVIRNLVQRVPPAKRTYLAHTWHMCSADCVGCAFCDGGLRLCTVCKKGEGELELDCPGAKEDSWLDA